jgi:hypothetical protein
MLSEFSPIHWLLVLLILSTFLIPARQILRRAGYSGWWCLFFLFPPLNLIGLWVFAFSPWPSLTKQV